MVDYKRFLIALCLLCSLPSAASAEDKFMRFLGWLDAWLEKGQRQGIDTNYIEVPKLNRQVYIGQYTYYQNYDMTMPFSIEDAQAIIPGIRNNDHYTIDAYTWQHEIELGIDWKGLALELPIPVRNKYLYSYGIAKNGSVWGARLRYKNLKSMDGHCNIGDQTIDKESNGVRTFFVEGYYVLFHKKFSLSAGLYADMVQKRSAGSPLFYANFYRSHYTISKTFPSNFDSFITKQVSVGAGYAYNLSLLQGNLVFHGSVVPMFSLYNNLIHETSLTSEENAEQWNDFYAAADQGHARFRVNVFTRFAVNYSFSRYIVTFLANYRNYGYKNKEDLRIKNQELDLQLNVCVRF